MTTARQIWSILLPGQRRSAVVLFALVVAGTFLETLSIGLVVPALAFMTRGGQAAPPGLTPWIEWLGNPSTSGLILVVLLILLAVYALKSAFLLFVAYWQSRFVTATQASTSRRLYAIYLQQPWLFHLQRHSSDLMRTMNEAREFSQTCSLFIMTVSEILALGGLISLLLWFEPLGATVVACLLGAAGWLFTVVIHGRSKFWGRTQRHHSKMAIKHAQQGFGSAKDVKIRGCEDQFLRQFRVHTDALARLAALQSFVYQMPRLWYELLAVAALLLLSTVMVWRGTPSERLIPMLGLFAAVAFRMLPSVNHVTTAIQKLRHSGATLDALQRELGLGQTLPPRPAAIPIRFHDSVLLENVSFRYPTGAHAVLDGISIRIPHGAAVGFVGGSGAGKSTLVDVILGLLPPQSGRVLVDGQDIHDNLRGWQDIIGYVPQSIYLCDESIRSNVAFGVPEDEIDDRAVRRALEAAQLDAFVASLPQGHDTTVGERGVRLSGGQRQRIGIARALYHDPQVLVLDEATSALDSDTEREVMSAVNALHGTKTLIIVAHRLTTVSTCDLLYRLEQGRVVQAGTFAEVVAP